jgi:hypothetical protein
MGDAGLGSAYITPPSGKMALGEEGGKGKRVVWQMRRGREEENAVEIPWGMVRIAVRMWSPISQEGRHWPRNAKAGFSRRSLGMR